MVYIRVRVGEHSSDTFLFHTGAKQGTALHHRLLILLYNPERVKSKEMKKWWHLISYEFIVSAGDDYFGKNANVITSNERNFPTS